ncbi:hypothetical protein CC86DRAFT_460839 [Ophiobolus disseminans]|uniref:BTB domain-containing protein n=1 Tax=Ophiobolus disseminans TaxID=1469910 RepID=A0A6A6ZCS8_9PLEO|nr:hypothetical protein CC86DRAFT_460839 [Ophiobolus disseminans]
MASPEVPAGTDAARLLKRKNNDFNRSPLIKAIVGEGDDQEEFNLHRYIITKKSGFFKSAFSGRWGNSESKKVDLLHLDPKYFAQYLEAVYTNKILPDTYTYEPGVISALCHVYVIAEEMIDASTKNLALRDLKRAICCEVGNLHWYPGKNHIATIYEATSSASNPARRFMISCERS